MEDDINPKDRVARLKISLSLNPPAALAHMAHALADGDRKYGLYNWRKKKVSARVYLDACERHMKTWQDGEEAAGDSGAHHLGHALACLAIIVDAMENGCLVDDRPPAGNASELLARLHQVEVERDAPEVPESYKETATPEDCGCSPAIVDMCRKMPEMRTSNCKVNAEGVKDDPAFRPWDDLTTEEKRKELYRLFGSAGHQAKACPCIECERTRINVEAFIGRTTR